MRYIYISANMRRDYFMFDKMIREREAEGYEINPINKYIIGVDKDTYMIIRDDEARRYRILPTDRIFIYDSVWQKSTEVYSEIIARIKMSKGDKNAI